MADNSEPGARQRGRAENTARILASARRQIAEHGAVGLSMRAVARDVGMVSSAVFRYFESREALLTELIIESYHHLADAVHDAVDRVGGGRSAADRWRAATRAARAWALQFPHEFQLIYGTPIPGYQAPPQTIPAAARVAGPFLEIAATGAGADDHPGGGFVQPVDVSAGATAGAVAELTQLIGFITMQLAGHFVGVVTAPDDYFDVIIERQVATLGLD
ncbi:TetR/AcrR family transcriptional regulator [Propionibacteriaceae bacterium G1746]|uniref:TetR/AcrR family transcriptional regulator n=1 Tax=Aestuariimicrobium sp. G57 TaxID=3418485 RepID=UPI003C26DDCE